MAEFHITRTALGRQIAQRHGLPASPLSTEVSLIDNLRLRSAKGGCQTPASIEQPSNFPSSDTYSPIQSLAQSIDMPFEVLEHLEALEGCEDSQFATGLKLAGDGKLKHFMALSRYNESKVLRLWRELTGQSGKVISRWLSPA